MYKYLTACILSLFLLNCGDKSTSKKTAFTIQTNKISFIIGDSLNLSINNPKNLNIESVQYTLNDKSIPSKLVLSDLTLGAKSLKAIITTDGSNIEISKTIELFNDKQPDIYTYEIVNEYPHDITSYTQGLEFYKGRLFESTGQYGESKLREVRFKTGEVIQNLNLDKSFFGEGLTILDNNLYQLTWRSGLGFIYDINSFSKTGSFKYGKSKEGWGLCNDGTYLYKSDGTERIWKLDPSNLTELSNIEVYTNKGKIPSINELEWVDGKIFANIYQRNGVAIINPTNGAVEGVIDFSPLRNMVTKHDGLDVLNGIAYNPETNTIFITGKRWDKLFEVTITKK